MPRKAKQEEPENHERWLVSYADFITLLFAFFVVMYSVSSVNEGKFRVLSESMEASFRSSNKSMSPIQIGRVVRKPQEGSSHSPVKIMSMGLSNMPPPRFSEPVKKTRGSEKGDGKGKGKGHAAEYKKKIKIVSKQIEKALLPLINKGLVKVKLNSQWIVVDINSSILFPSGGAHLARQAVPVLERIAKILKPLSSSIQVEGFTDNIPISNLVYPSNWELSAARAASVVHLFARVGVNPVRMAAIGYGEFQPVASNKTVLGRQKNRRVVLRVNTSADKRFNQLTNISSVKSVSKVSEAKPVKTKVTNGKVITTKKEVKNTSKVIESSKQQSKTKKRSATVIRPVIKPIVLPAITKPTRSGRAVRAITTKRTTRADPASRRINKPLPAAIKRTAKPIRTPAAKRIVRPVRSERATSPLPVSKPVGSTNPVSRPVPVDQSKSTEDIGPGAAVRKRDPTPDEKSDNFDLNSNPEGLPPLR